MPPRKRALRTTVSDPYEPFAARARELGVYGWVRPSGEVHAEGLPAALAALGVEGERVKLEGHEQ